MVKVFLGFFVAVVTALSVFGIVGSTSVHASASGVVMSHIQAGGVGAATQEFIAIYNNSSEEVDITGWCLLNKLQATIACFHPPLVGQALYLPARQQAVAASSAFAALRPVGTITTTYQPLSQSRGSITGSADTITLVDQTGSVIDQQAWTVSLASGSQFIRRSNGQPLLYSDTDMASDWVAIILTVFPVDQTVVDETIIDICPNLEGLQLVVPDHFRIESSGNCVAVPMLQLLITELLPNATGSDDGQEFIEIFNPNEVSLSLNDYHLKVGPQLEARYDFPKDMIIAAGGYSGFTNKQIPFNLLNSSSRVQIIDANGDIVIDVPAYLNPLDGYSWALIDTQWQYTNRPTMGMENLTTDEGLLEQSAEVFLQPCAANQYRSLETNRCRLIAGNSGTVAPCKDNQYRSEETNRCRNIVSDTKTVTPCDADQERNPETNRCRNIVVAAVQMPCKVGQERNPDTNRCKTVVKMPAADYAVLGAATTNSGHWYVWAAVGGVLLLALGYAVWEWHSEIGKFFQKLYRQILRFARFRK